jgi:predicted acylesterase/phospholipase RssA
MTLDPQRTAVACGGAGFRAAFAHGVLTALELHGFRAAAYGGSSLASLAAVCAAAGEAEKAGVTFWLRGLDLLQLPGNGMSDLALNRIAEMMPIVAPALVAPGAPRLCIATTAVHTIAGAVETQGIRAGALGRRLLVHAERHDRSWANEHLTAHLWDSGAAQRSHLLTQDNLEEVLYASSRLLHGWAIPAEVDGAPFIDGVYTSTCPALELSALEYRDVIAIAPEPGQLYKDLFQTQAVPETSWRSRIRIIRPSLESKTFGVDAISATERGLVALFDHGLDRGLHFIAEHLDAKPAPERRWEWPDREPN